MSKTLLAVAAAAVVLAATPAVARHDHVTTYRVGYSFGPSYTYTDYTALPQPIVTRYHLRNNFRYVNDNGYVYVVNPRTYRVVRVIRAPM
ncbi:MAG TPA: hypothetical protein VHS33_13600 [Sphingomicrobium sp.]|jgi:hypothetical protein|nr:hypothetical protein [Sphingomicrobium sp.]